MEEELTEDTKIEKFSTPNDKAVKREQYLKKKKRKKSKSHRRYS